MSLLVRMYRGTTDFDFVGNWRRFFAISATLLLISSLSLVFRQLNLGVDFIGGTIVESPNEAGAKIEDVRSALADIGQAQARAQLTRSVDGEERIRVQTGELDDPRLNQLIDLIAEVGGVDASDVSSQSVGPTFGAQVAQSALRALLIFLVVVVVFISIRFEWKMALAGLGALIHDLLLTAGVYSLVGFEVTPATVIAVLTILGYSLYDTVVVFDKVRENIEDGQQKNTMTGIVNDSMNEVLMRSINTSATSLLPVGSLLFVGSFLLGAATLREFALALFVGIAAGTYSSIFFASPLLAIWKEREPEWQRAQRRAARKAGAPFEPARPKRTRVAAAEEDAPKAVTTAKAEPKEEPAITRAVSGAAPRPPKRRGKRRR